MPSLDAANAPAADWPQAEQDLGPLAWVLDELRKSLDGAVKSLRRFVREADLARESDLASLDAGALRIARQQLHQASGALEMVGMAPPALVLRSMEAAVQKFVQRPEHCGDDAVSVLERASFALVEYLDNVLAGKTTSPVALFPQYREVQALTGAERVHPADLWPVERRFREPDLEVSAPALPYGPEARARLDSAVLRIVKLGDKTAAGQLRDACLGFVASQPDRQSRAFWKICAGFFDAFSHGLLTSDVYVKRVASRVLMQYATLAKGDTAIADRLVQDLLFFCSQARTPETDEATTAPALHAVRQAFGLSRFKPVDYETPRFGLYDPAVLAQARRRIAAAAETWSALAGGDRNKLKPSADQFSLVCDSLGKLHPGSDVLASALTRVVEATARSGEPPSPALAMEVATSVLYLQAAFEELDTAQDYMAERAARLAERLDRVAAGGEPEPLEHWMEELYRRVSDHQTMGSVVGELRATLAEAEKAMDQFFRNPADLTVLTPVPDRLAQMRGVLSVLGLDQASLAVVRMRDTVERLLTNEIADAERQTVFEKLGNSLGALGFLIDMLSYQRTMARKLFVYDEELGELRLLMGRARARATDTEDAHDHDAAPAAAEPVALAAPTAPAPAAPHVESAVDAVSEPVPASAHSTLFELESATPPKAAPVAEADVEFSFDLDELLTPQEQHPVESLAAAVPFEPVPVPAAAPLPAADEEDQELLDIFLEEAREVVANGLAAVQALRAEPGDLSEQTTLRRAFHTLKGSSRMVGLNPFGDAAWSMEQALNAWLAEQKPMPPALLDLSEQSLQAFGRWADAIAEGDDSAWHPQPFRDAADTARAGEWTGPLQVPGAQALADAAQAAPAADIAAEDSQLLVEDVPHTSHDAQEAAPHPDFADTTLSDYEADWPVPLDAEGAVPLPVQDIAEDIDFAAFTQALEDADAAAADKDAAATSVDFLSLETTEIPEAELNAVEEQEAADSSAETTAPVLPNELADVTLNAPEDEALQVVEPPSEDTEPTQEPGADDLLLSADPEKPQVEREIYADRDEVSVVDAEGAQPESLAPVQGDEPADAAELSVPATTDEAVKVIDTLRIGIPLYNVYLNEADEWSRRLATTLQEWALELHEPLPDTAVALAHSLAGSSATVGFAALSEMARTLEHALQHVQLQPRGVAAQAAVFNAAAEDIRRLLHQFAAGFLKEPNAQVLEQLRAILQTEVETGSAPLGESVGEDLHERTDFSEASDATDFLPLSDLPASLPPALSDDFDFDAAPEVVPGYVAPALSVPVEVDHDQRVDDAIARAVALGADIDDDIDALDVIDPDLFPIFEEEAIELLPSLGGALRQWVARPDNMGARSELLRALHTLKGSSRLAGAMRLGEMAHRMESAVEQIDTEEVPRSEDIEPLLAHLDGLQASFGALRAIGAQPLTEPVAVVPGTMAPAAEALEAASASLAPVQPVRRVPLSTGPLAARSPAAGHSVRVRAQLLDRLVNQAGEVMIARSRLDVRVGQMRTSLGELSGNLDRLRQQLRDIEVQAESQMQSRLALSKDSGAGFDPLEFDRFTRVQELTRMMAESVNDVATVQRNLQRTVESAEDDLIAQGRQARELQRDLLRTRMVEFEGIAERLYAVVRQTSKETGKQIKLDISGGSIEMDRGVLDRMTPAFEHLLRNCVAHGIENPEERAAAGKPAVGTITVALRQEGNDVSVDFRDDGAGLNLDRIRARAVAQGLVTEDADISADDAAHLIFLPGFSTASEVTELSGRGIGMDVVRSEVQALGGRIETGSQPGQGTSFRMVLPLTTAVTQVVMLRAGHQSIGVPANLVEIVRRATAAELDECYRTGQFEDGVESVPFFWSGALLQSSARSNEPAGRTRPVVVLRSASQRIALHVDEVLGNQEVVVKNLGPQLSRLPGLAGMSVLASGAVVLIYNPVALSTVYGEQVRAAAQAASAAGARSGKGSAGVATALQSEPNSVPLVLVVDDSITVRRVTQRLLQREGYRVALAADGLQALERLQDERPTLVLSDIEMPRMDGFDLARNIRGDAVLRDLPIIMITSRIAQKHRDHAMELGVNHYLGKPYSDEELLSLVKHYAQKAAQALEA
ncbi:MULTISPECIES: Hpt domain-containing protein [unclassified Acidovorax]|uniref:hybrid sensor histidine kinase/response regulator n=1 Tax=unclassified Acidovorax TaxID=2684926 RepID=UPI002882DA6D|nr:MULTISPECIES: Hpt domain-containing protein [unclassified Acidovorax]